MSIGKGGSSGNQSQNTDYTGSGTTAGLGFNMPIAPQGYGTGWNSLMGMNGQTPQSAQANSFWDRSGLLNPNQNSWYGLGNLTSGLQAQENPNSFANNYGKASAINVPQVNAQGANAFMGNYQNPYTQDVVNATGADMSQQFKQGLNDLSAQYGGQYGNSREGVAAGQALGDFSRAYGSTIGGLRSQGFNTALGAGQGDASNALAASQANAGNSINAQEFTGGLQNQRDMFAAQNALNAAQAHGGLTSTAANIGMNAAQGAQSGANSTFANLIGSLGAGVPLFGSSSFNLGANQGSGNQQSQGKSSSKGGGISAG